MMSPSVWTACYMPHSYIQILQHDKDPQERLAAEPSYCGTAFLVIIHVFTMFFMFCPYKILLYSILIHPFPVSLSSVFVTGTLALSFLRGLAMSVTTFLCPGFPEGTRKERF